MVVIRTYQHTSKTFFENFYDLRLYLLISCYVHVDVLNQRYCSIFPMMLSA